MKKDIEKQIKNIQKAIDDNNVAIFVGAGVSANSNVPTWGSLINDFAIELDIKGRINPSDYLKISQFYYNKHKKNFINIVKSKLNNNWNPNVITELLFEEYNSKYFITTNYDDILEKTAQKISKPYISVSKDIDIPKIGNNSAIIKMHGDFKSNNIILKESDYLIYSENFKLMETFVKSLFATNTILFVGFSADDPNVNQIYSWVNNILTKNKREAYLLQIEEPDYNYKYKREYYSKKGIKLINYYELQDDIQKFNNSLNNQKLKSDLKKLSKDKGKKLYELLFFILKYASCESENYYNKLLPTKYLNFINNSDFLNIIEHPYWYCNKGVLSSSDTAILKLIIDLKKNKLLINETKKLFAKNGVKRIEATKYQKEEVKILSDIQMPVWKDIDFKAFEYINSLNYKEAYKYLKRIGKRHSIDKYIDNNISSVNVFERAYLLYKLKKYQKSYKLLTKISYKAKEKGYNVIFAISEFNRKIVGLNYYDEFRFKRLKGQKSYFDNLYKELMKINIQNIINAFLSKTEQKVIADKLNFDYIKSLQSNIYKQMNEKKDIVPWLKGLYYSYICNYIFIENYVEYQNISSLIIKGNFESIKRQRDGEYRYIIPRPAKITFDYIELINAVTIVKPNYLKKIVHEYEIKNILLTNNVQDKKDLLQAFNNWIEYLTEKTSFEYEDDQMNYLYNFFIIFSLINLTKTETSKIIKKYISLIKTHNLLEYQPVFDNIINYVLEFIIIKYNDINTRKTICEKILTDFIKYVYTNIKELSNLHQITINCYIRFIRNMANILEGVSQKREEINFDIQIDNKNVDYWDLCTYLYKISNKSTKSKIKKNILHILNDNFNAKLYHNACLENIIVPQLVFEEKICSYIDDKITEYNKLKLEKPNTYNGATNNPIGLDEIYKGLIYLANLINNDKIVNIEKLKQYKNHKDFKNNNYFNFTLDFSDYDYNDFDLSYLEYLTNERLERLKKVLSDNPINKKIVKQKFFEQIKINNDIENFCKKRLLYILYNEDYKA